MEPRKIQKVGYNSLSLTLPKIWTQNQNIGHGDTLFCLEESDGSMRLIPGNLAQQMEGEETPTYQIDADTYRDPGLMEKIIIGNYILGRNHIVVKAQHRISNRHLKEVRSAVNRLMGVGIMEETPQKVVLQTALDRDQFTVSALLKRLYNLIATMVADCMEALQTLDWEMAENVVQREKEADKLYWLIIRLIHTSHPTPLRPEGQSGESTLDLMGNRAVAKDIESIGDHAESIASLVTGMKEQGCMPPPAEVYSKIRELSQEAEIILKEAMAALMSRDLVLANNAISRQQKAEQTDNELHVMLKGIEDPNFTPEPLHKVVIHLRNIARFGTSIATMAINRSLQSQA